MPRLENPDTDITEFGYLTGWRIDEILPLRWLEVDRAHHEIRIPDSKNEAGRVIPIVGPLAELIERRWRKRVAGSQLVPWVFHRQGRRVPNDSFNHRWCRACRVTGLEAKDAPAAQRHYFHDVRRTFVRDSVEAGHDLTTAMQSTGHKTVSVANRYNIRDTRLIARDMVDLHAHRAKLARTVIDPTRQA